MDLCPRVLIVEDELDWRKILAEYVAKTEWKSQAIIEYAENISKASRLLKKELYDLVLIDLKLAEWEDEETFGGMEVLKLLDEFARGKPTKAIVISAYGTPVHVRKAWKEHGVLDYFDKKHLEQDQVVEAIEKAIRAALTERQSIACRRVLIVEDDEEWQEILRVDIEALGHEAKIVRRRRHALKELEQQVPDLVVLDLVLDQDSVKYAEGMEVLSRVVAQDTPVIIVSAFGTVALVDRAFREYGVIAFIDKKRYDPSEFKDIVQKVIGSSEQPLSPEDQEKVAELKKRFLERIRSGEPIAFEG